MNRIIKKGFSRVFTVAKAFLLISSCLMVSNLWTMESDENRTKDGYYTAELINKTGSALFVVVTFFNDLTDRYNGSVFAQYSIKNGEHQRIRVKNPKGEIGSIFITLLNKKAGGNTYFNVGDREDIKVGKTYVVTGAEKGCPS